MIQGSDGSLVQRVLDAFVEIASARDTETVTERSIELACDATGAPFAAAVVFDESGIVGLSARGMTDEQALSVAASTEPLGEGVVVRRSAGEVAAVLSPKEQLMAATLTVTVSCEGTPISGAIYLAKPEGEIPFSDKDEMLVRALARQAANALITVRLLDEREKQGERRSAARFTRLVEHSSDVITVIDRDGRIRFQSPSITRVLGFGQRDLLGTDSLDLVHPDDRPRVSSIIRKAMKESDAVAVFECRLRATDGTWRHCEISLKSRLRDPDLQGVVLNTRDVTERKLLEEKLAHQAFHDALTDLPNRELFRDRVDHALERGRRLSDTAIGVLFMDLDDFKTINDSLGHAAGDRLLVAVAQRLKEQLRGSDTAARLGGDEFALLLEDMKEPKDAEIVAERVLQAMRAPFDVEGQDVYVHPSIGVALGDAATESADDLLRDADVAMYRAKASGKGCYTMFEQSMYASLLERLDLEADLRRAVSRNEFVVYYQPTVKLQTSMISGMEALVRWEHPERGLVFPGDFIHLAEDTGLIVDIGRQVLREACQKAREWQVEHPNLPPLTMSVNLSAKQLQHPGLVADVVGAIDDSGLDPACLILEITESVLMQFTDVVSSTLDELKELGVRLAIDDFGTGYSSLARLQRLPVDILKIDRSFIAGLESGSQDWAVARAIIELGQSLRLETVAEGIELAEQLVHLQSLQCDRCQGFYFAKPLDPETMGRLLRRADQGQDWIGEELAREEAPSKS
ncbi:MAG TPA: EAL domain-containing protein [Actinomycetota bacterium]|jgi:diguanylate cyclase (GGDEF)-like protein/PAS domain S-box-containing protein|nr:EAL domain-containing protein [Actinomycetota bacterium]